MTPTYTAETSKQFTMDDRNTAPKFQVTYKNGQVKIYEIDVNSLKNYYDGYSDSISYTVVDFDTTDGTTTTKQGTTIATTEDLKSATMQVDEFECTAKVTLSTKKCDVTVRTKSENVEKIEFVKLYDKKIYRASEKKDSIAMKYTLNGKKEVIKIKAADLEKLYDAKVGETVKFPVYGEDDSEHGSYSVEKKDATKLINYHLVDGPDNPTYKIELGIYLDTKAKAATFVVSTDSSSITELSLE